ncbi:NAD(P)/FAD-dependent oxidoreductase [Spectribacter hydrogenooxidans]|uniref:FAD-dependent oxidoreductase n=1 Tax=Spectribacter hydrogenoxidans TaxID=3075608 RepID=A0ABU3C206_9GAMM|nr:FAD-dependent oxidoreductase [Salinisphaera sp. W335]MDT0635406.1 FAD-dependent oxidoreductase [Salinisphaera sp. W335]
MARPDHILIAGGGLIGLMTAWYARQAGYAVTLFEADRVARGASWAGGGVLWPIYPWRYPESVQAAAAAGARLYPALCRDLHAATGIDCELRRTGVVILDAGEQQTAREWAARAGHAWSAWASGELGRRLPGSQHRQGIWLPCVAQVRNPRLGRALAAALQLAGVSIREQCAVTRLHAGAEGFQGFETAQGWFRGDFGVVATGAWTDEIPGMPALAGIRPVKGQMLLLRGRPGALPHILVHDGCYAIPRADGRILIGSTVEESGFDARPTAAGRQVLEAAAAALHAPLVDLPIEAHWAGLRPAASDGEPVVGPVAGWPGVFVNTGHFRNGVACAPAAGQALVRAIDETACQPWSTSIPR